MIDKNSRTSKLFQKANSLISLNRRKINHPNNDIIGILTKENQNEKVKNRIYNNSFNKITSKSRNISFYISKNGNNETIYSNMKKIMKNNYNNYYVSSNLFHNDYISDFMSCKSKTTNNEIEKMKETDDKIEKLVKVLNIYPNPNQNTIYRNKSQNLLSTEKTNDNEVNINTGKNEVDSILKNNKNNNIFAKKKSKKTKIRKIFN